MLWLEFAEYGFDDDYYSFYSYQYIEMTMKY